MKATLAALAFLAVAACTGGQGGQDAGTPHVYATALPDGGTATWWRDVAPLAQKHVKAGQLRAHDADPEHPEERGVAEERLHRQHSPRDRPDRSQ